jgi:hypothetical protein
MWPPQSQGMDSQVFAPQKKKEKPVCDFADLLPAPDRHTSSSSTSLSSPAGFAMDSQRRWRAPS